MAQHNNIDELVLALQTRAYMRELQKNAAWLHLTKLLEAQAQNRRAQTNAPTKTFEEVFARNTLIGEADGLLTAVNMPAFLLENADSFIQESTEEEIHEAQKRIDGTN